jgi:hypothetical protein
LIRNFDFDTDVERAKEIHAANELPENCFPNLTITIEDGETVANPLFIVKAVYEHQGKIAMMSFLKVTGELFLLLSHDTGTPEQRWQWLCEFKDWMKAEGARQGLEQLTAWIPPEIEESFGKRLLDLGFVRSPWISYTLNL